MRIVFMGSSNFACPIITLLASNPEDFEIISVYTTPPKPAGRGLVLTQTPVHVFAEQLKLKIITPITLKQHQLEECDAVVLAAYGKILPDHILETPKYGCINLHPSLLPRWRGATPIQHTLLHSDSKTGISIIKMNEKLDEGDLLYQEEIAVNERHNFSTLHNELAEKGAKAMIKVLKTIKLINQYPQTKEGATYASKLIKQPINWSLPIKKIIGYIKAMDGAMAVIPKNKTIKIIWADTLDQKHDFIPGTIINTLMHIACSDGILIPKIVQIPGKKPLPIEEFLKGYHNNHPFN